jgi:flagellar biosynthesis regulator FlbT
MEVGTIVGVDAKTAAVGRSVGIADMSLEFAKAIVVIVGTVSVAVVEIEMVTVDTTVFEDRNRRLLDCRRGLAALGSHLTAGAGRVPIGC